MSQMSEKSFSMKLDEIQPSQLYVNSEKLNTVMKGIRTSQQIEPIPIKKLGNSIVFVDGHTRALAAFMNDFARVPVYWESEDLDWEAYEVCVEWCKEEGILAIADLRDRIISDEEYEKLWLDRCMRMQEELKQKRINAQSKR